MHRLSPVICLCLCLAFAARGGANPPAAEGHAAKAAVVFEQAKLAPAAAIEWEGRSHETVEAKIIREPLAIRLEACTGIVITACDLSSIQLIGCTDVTIRNCWIHDSGRNGVELGGCHRVTIEGCRLENLMAGVSAVDSQGVHVVGNFSRNMQGPLPRGEFAQFDSVYGADNVIRDNYAINDRGKSHAQDIISIYKCTGTEESPILVENNYLAGDSATGSEDASPIGSGIMLGDYGGAHIVCRHNIIIAAGQVGLGVAGGRFIRVEGNLVFGDKSNVSNTGLYVWNQSGKPCDHVSVIGNRVHWNNKDGEETSWWDGGGVTELEQKDNYFADATLPASLPAPPSHAPLPPKPWASVNADGTSSVRLPWKLE